MSAGKLDQLITLQSLVETNNSGESSPSWTVIESNVPAEVISLHGSESMQAAKESATETVRIRIRYRDDVQNTWRLTWEGQNYNMVYVDRTEKRKGNLWITAQITGAT